MNLDEVNALANSLVTNDDVQEAIRAVQAMGPTGGNRLTNAKSIAKYQLNLYTVTCSVIRAALKAGGFVPLEESVLYTDEMRAAMDDLLRQGNRKVTGKITQEQLDAENKDIHGAVIRYILSEAMRHGAAPGGALFLQNVTPTKHVAIGGKEVRTYEADSQQEVRLAGRNDAKTGGAGLPRKKRGPPTPLQDEIQDDTEPVKAPSGRAKKARKQAKADSPPESPQAGPAPTPDEVESARKLAEKAARKQARSVARKQARADARKQAKASLEADPAPEPEDDEPAPEPEDDKLAPEPEDDKPATPATPEADDDDVEFTGESKAWVDLSLDDD